VASQPATRCQPIRKAWAVNGKAFIEEFDSVTYTADEEYRKAGYLGDGGAIVFVETGMGNVFLNVLEEDYFDTH